MFLAVQENSDLLGSLRELEDKVWKLERDLRQAESIAGLRDPRSGKRRASRDQLVQTVTRQADTIARLQEQLMMVQKGGEGEGGAEGAREKDGTLSQQEQVAEEATPTGDATKHIILPLREQTNHNLNTVAPTH
ncbi:hypothetical protein Hamer_G028788 [Homarus americanus]|uniref:Uncharacterized protein n=1 Tax=Homarus americanus TaxID=6706 RepID=A0A8J5K2W9_HOMAM|nr:hypothetical protein Hamer_G028788 [Homarus americanus]